MSEPFDPYHKWLGIPPKDQPPHHYRLLGIELFENDAEVVESAANRLMSYLHEVAAGDETGLSQKLLNEISAARICLLNQPRKSAYDAQLTAELSHKVPEARVPVATTTATIAAGYDVQPAARKSRWPKLTGLVLGITVLGIVLALGYNLFRRAKSSALSSETVDVGGETSRDRAPQRHAELILDWPASQRLGATLNINGTAQLLPTTDVLEIPLVAGPLELRVTRPGYVDVLWTCIVARGERIRYSPAWEPLETNAMPAAPAVEKSQPPIQDHLPTAPHVSADSRTHDGGRPTQDESDQQQALARLWQSLPSYLDVPPVSDSAAASETTLLHLPHQTPLELRLVGGESLFAAASFEMTTHPSMAEGQTWTVQYADRQHRTEVAELTHVGGKLNFHWRPESGLRQADQLRNTMLAITDQRCGRTFSLRKATPIGPLAIDGAKGMGQMEVRVETLPDSTKLKLEWTRCTGAASFVHTFKEKVAVAGEKINIDLGAAELDYPLEFEASFRIPRAGGRLVQLQYQLRYRSRFGPLVPWSRRTIAQDVSMAQNLLHQRAGAANQDQLRSNLDYYSQLSQIARGTSKLNLHFRIFLPIEDSQIILATTD